MRTFSRRLMTALVTLGLTMGLTTSANAQNKKIKEDLSVRTLQGTVTDADDKPINGAVVQLKDMRTLQVRSFITQDVGTYHFSGLKVENDYQVKAEFSGASSDTKTLSVFDNRRTPVMNLKLEKK